MSQKVGRAVVSGVAANSQGPWSSTGRSRVGRGRRSTLVLSAMPATALTCRTAAGDTAQGLQTYIAYQSGTQGPVTVTGTGSTWTNRNALYVGYGGTGAMNVTGGAVATPQYTTDIGYQPGSTGRLGIGGGSKFTVTDPLTVGTQGQARSRSRPAALLALMAPRSAINRARGMITVDGAGSSFTNGNGPLFVGKNGTGSLALTGGASATVSASVGFGTGSSGSVSVDGAGTSLSGGVTLVAHAQGRIALGHQWRQLSGNLQYSPGSVGPLSATFDGTGTTGNTTMTLFVGTGTLNIQNGAVVNTPSSGASRRALSRRPSPAPARSGISTPPTRTREPASSSETSPRVAAC